MEEKLKYVKSFDGMRGVFCMLIVWQHMHFKSLNMPFAALWPALQIFFMLSGYLITKILIYEVSFKPGIKPFLRRFFRRRIYRIFPLYFIFLLALVLICVLFKNSIFVQSSELIAELRQNGWMLFTYTYNFKEIFNLLMDQPYMISPITVHLWSLSVEEQFYLLIPFLVFFIPKKNLTKTLIVIVVVVQILRIATYYYLTNHTQVPHDATIFILHRNFVFQLDSLAMGGLLASTSLVKMKHAKSYFNVGFLIFVGLTILIAYNASLNHEFTFMEIINSHAFLLYGGQVYYMYTLVNVVIMLMIICSIQNNSVAKWLFENRVTVYLGKISYGIYVYQFFILFLIAAAVHTIKPNFSFTGSFLKEIFFLGLAWSLLVAFSALSYKYIEKPFLKLKYKGDKK